jgi:hypothetical protein
VVSCTRIDLSRQTVCFRVDICFPLRHDRITQTRLTRLLCPHSDIAFLFPYLVSGIRLKITSRSILFTLSIRNATVITCYLTPVIDKASLNYLLDNNRHKLLRFHGCDFWDCAFLGSDTG